MKLAELKQRILEMEYVRPFLRVYKRELKHIFKRWPLLFVTFLGPLFSFFLITCIFYSSVPRDLPVAIIDMDHTPISRQMARMIDATSIAAVNRNFTSLDEAKKAIENGTVDAALYIPAGTEKEIYHGLSARPALYLNNGNVVKGGLLNSGIRKALGTLSAGIKLQVQMKNGYIQDQAMSRIMPVQLRSELLFNPYISYSYYLTAGLLPILLIVFIILGTVYSVGSELYQGTGPGWLKSANDNIIVAITGKILPYTLIYYSMAMFMNIILFKFLGMPLRGNLHMILVSELLLILSYQFVSIFLVSLTTNMRLSMSLGAAYSMLALTYSGLTFPAFGMPAIGQAFSCIFPFTYWIKILIGQSLRGEPLSNGIWPMYTLFLFIILGILYIPRLRYMLLNKKRWGKI
jgi:ABC-2 type transport system permease protein